MKMKKVNIKSYKVEIVSEEGVKEVPYSVVKSIENIMLSAGQGTSQRLSMTETLRNARIAEKIKAAESKGYILLEEAEFSIVKSSFDAFRGFSKNEVELCKRITEAEEVEVEEKGKKKK